MELKRLTGTFGVLEEDTLVLSPGLNLIHAPNESGKSTWCALLRVMLYGLSTRARGAAADKNRYAPWSGRPMQGVLEVAANGVDLTVTRTTQRSNAPMGAFPLSAPALPTRYPALPPPPAGSFSPEYPVKFLSAALLSASPVWPLTRTRSWNGGLPP